MRRITTYHPMNKRPSGFSLIEVLITLVIIAIVAGLSAPAILSMAPNMALKSATQDLYSSIQEAKILAVKMNRSVSVRSIAGGYFIDLDGDANPDTGEDANLNKILDAGEDSDADGILDLSEDLNNNGVFDAGEDLDADGFFDSTPEKYVIFVNDYNYNIKFGTGNTADDWRTPAVPCNQANSITFNSRGLPTVTPAGSSFYIDYTDPDGDNSLNCFAVETSVAGSVNIHKYNGNNWMD